MSSSNSRKRKSKRNLSQYLPNFSNLNNLNNTSSFDNTISMDYTIDMPEMNNMNTTAMPVEVNSDIVSLCWNTTGKMLGAGYKHEINIWELGASGLKLAMKKAMHNFDIVKIKYISELLIGGKSKNGVRFWDLRVSACAKVFELPVTEE